MEESTKYAIKKNLIFWIAYVHIGEITLEQAVERIESYYLGMQEVLDFDEIKEVFPIFMDVRAMLNQLGSNQEPMDLFPNPATFEEETLLNKTLNTVEADLDKFIQLHARKL